jgi:hypothetical protein
MRYVVVVVVATIIAQGVSTFVVDLFTDDFLTRCGRFEHINNADDDRVAGGKINNIDENDNNGDNDDVDDLTGAFRRSSISNELYMEAGHFDITNMPMPGWTDLRHRRAIGVTATLPSGTNRNQVEIVHSYDQHAFEIQTKVPEELHDAAHINGVGAYPANITAAFQGYMNDQLHQDRRIDQINHRVITRRIQLPNTYGLEREL